MNHRFNRASALVAFACAAAPLVAAQAGGARLVLSESFEAPQTANYTVVRAGQSFRTRNHVWKVEQASIDIANTAVRREVTAFDGRQVIDLAGSPGPGVISTRFATAAGQTYTLVLHYARNNGIGRTPAVARVEVVGNGVLLQQELRHDPARLPFNSYREYRGTFRADATMTTLRFTSLNAGNFGIVLDALAVSGGGPDGGSAAPAPLARAPVAAPVAPASPGGSTMTGGSVEERYRGTWVANGAACDSPVKLVIEANKVSFINGSQRANFTKLEQCFSCAAGGMTTERQPVWLTTDKMGDSPWQLTLDDTRKGRVVVTAEISNDKKMAARFPLGSGALKKCS